MTTNLVNGKRYVGATSKGLDYRRKRHLSLAANRGRSCPRLYDAIRKHGAQNFDWIALKEFPTFGEALLEEARVIGDWLPEYNVAAGGAGAPGLVPVNRIPVICLDDGLVYESARAAATSYRCNHGEICKALKCPGTTAGGRYFERYSVPLTEAERKLTIHRARHIRAQLRRKRSVPHLSGNGRECDGVTDSLGRKVTGPMKAARPVRCLDDGKVFKSASAAARAYDVPRSGLIELCLGKRNRKTIGGLRFAYADGIF